MKLNMAKCTFEVDSRKFLGFIVSERGIEANIEKIKAIMEIRPPRNISKTQRLTSKIVELNRFVSRSTDNSLLLFRVLCKVHPWNDDCDKAFQELKQYLSNPQLLSQPKQGYTLYVYLAVSPYAMSKTFVKEE